MTKDDFFEIIKNNIHFCTRKEKKDFYEFYNDLILEMKESGKTEEEAVEALNVNEIIEQYNSNNKIDYEYEEPSKELFYSWVQSDELRR